VNTARSLRNQWRFLWTQQEAFGASGGSCEHSKKNSEPVAVLVNTARSLRVPWRTISFLTDTPLLISMQLQSRGLVSSVDTAKNNRENGVFVHPPPTYAHLLRGLSPQANYSDRRLSEKLVPSSAPHTKHVTTNWPTLPQLNLCTTQSLINTLPWSQQHIATCVKNRNSRFSTVSWGSSSKYFTVHSDIVFLAILFYLRFTTRSCKYLTWYSADWQCY
jgi:hypothetical protein